MAKANSDLPEVGDRIKMVGLMQHDPDPIPVDTTGTVTEVRAAVGQIDVDWDPISDSRPRSLILLVDDPHMIINLESPNSV